MPNAYQATRNLLFQKLFSANQSGASITAPSATTTEPSGSGIIDPAAAGQQAFNSIALQFYGTRSSADNETFTGRITGWRRLIVSGATIWIPVPLLALAMTQGTMVGVAGAPVVATEYFADTITASTAFTSAYEIINPTAEQVALVKLDTFGCERVQVQLAKGTNATCNGVWAGF